LAIKLHHPPPSLSPQQRQQTALTNEQTSKFTNHPKKQVKRVSGEFTLGFGRTSKKMNRQDLKHFETKIVMSAVLSGKHFCSQFYGAASFLCSISSR
jgi:hypothetical protein